ncbi:5-(carboxyamino)imidazole ribonucleotide mutase [Patescibacteria group bacterium]|nr:5-(carboxyamino)imidazole ribonucleotide mutase [Patescibacteria group bacterium]
MNKIKVAVIMGSDSDLPVMQEAEKVLKDFLIPCQVMVMSAHRSPDVTAKFARSALDEGVKVIIAGAGGAAHLAGVVAAHFPLPVIGVPIKTAALAGVDSLYSIVQMPPGIPVATVGINAAKNAGLLAVEILAASDRLLQQKLKEYKKKLSRQVAEKNEKLLRLGVTKYLEAIKK